MRILVTSSPGVGHLLPLLPLAREARERGHEVLVGVGAGLASTVASAGFEHAPVGLPTLGQAVAAVPELVGLTGRRRAVVTFRRVFCEAIATAIATDVLSLAERWRPDVIVHEDMDLGSGVAAERLGIPHATIQATAWRPRMRDLAQEPMDALRRQHGLSPDPGLIGLYGAMFFTTRPASMRDPSAPLPGVTAELRPIADDRLGQADDSTMDPFPAPDGRPRIAITLGTVNADQVGLMRLLIDGAAAVGGHVVVALGADPSTLGPVPAGVDVRAYVPMSTLLQAADIVVFHGGSGTMLAALAAGRPMVIVPLAADQPDNADLCAAAGAARVLAADGLTIDAVRQSIEAVLTDPTFRQRAADIAAEITAMPGPDAALDRIEALTDSTSRSIARRASQ